MTTRSGYAVTIRGFIPVDPSDLADHGEVIAAITAAKALATSAYEIGETPSADAMIKQMEVETFEVRPITRREKTETDDNGRQE